MSLQDKYNARIAARKKTARKRAKYVAQGMSGKVTVTARQRAAFKRARKLPC